MEADASRHRREPPRKRAQLTPTYAQAWENEEARFRQWLASKRPDEPVGAPLNPCSCPFTNWFKTRGWGDDNLRCTRWSMFWTMEGHEHETSYPLPNWAKRLATDLMIDHYHDRSVTAAQVLALLDRPHV